MTAGASIETTRETGHGPALPRLSWRHLAYFVGVPLTVATYAALNNWEMQHIAGLGPGLFFYLAHSMLPWWTTCLLTTGTKATLATWKPPWLLILMIGHTLGCLVVTYFSNWLTGIYETAWPQLEITGQVVPLLSGEFWIYWARAGIIWIGINFLFDRFFGLPLYRYVIPRGYESGPLTANTHAEGGWPGKSPGFIDRLPAALKPEEVLAIKAEQHYIKVLSPEKDYMVLYRFSDAVRELDELLGHQVHRSWWVNTSSIDSVQARAKDFRIRLKNGADVPVSGPYQGMIRELARNQRLPMKG